MSPPSLYRGVAVGEDVFSVLCSPTDVAPIVEANLASIFPGTPVKETHSGAHAALSKPPMPIDRTASSRSGGRGRVGEGSTHNAPPLPKAPPKPNPAARTARNNTGPPPVVSRKPPVAPYKIFTHGRRGRGAGGGPKEGLASKAQRSKAEALAWRLTAIEQELVAAELSEAEERGANQLREDRHRQGIHALAQHCLATEVIPVSLRDTVARIEPKARHAIHLEELEHRAATLHRYHTFGIVAMKAAEQHLASHYDTLLQHTTSRAYISENGWNNTKGPHSTHLPPREDISPLSLPQPLPATIATLLVKKVASPNREPSTERAGHKNPHGPHVEGRGEAGNDDEVEEAEMPPPPPPRRAHGNGGGMGTVTSNDRLFMDLEEVRLAFERAPTKSFAATSAVETSAVVMPPVVSRSVAANVGASVWPVSSRLEESAPTLPTPPPRTVPTSGSMTACLPAIPRTHSNDSLFPAKKAAPQKPVTVSLPSLLASSARDHRRIRMALSEGGKATPASARYDISGALPSPRKPTHGSRTYDARLQAALARLREEGAQATPNPVTADKSGACHTDGPPWMEASTWRQLVKCAATPLCDDEALQRKLIEVRTEPRARQEVYASVQSLLSKALEEEELRQQGDKHVLRCDQLREHTRATSANIAVGSIYRDVFLVGLEGYEAILRGALAEEADIATCHLMQHKESELRTIQRAQILQDDEPLMRARIEWLWEAGYCPQSCIPCPTSIDDVFAYSAHESRFRSRRVLLGGAAPPRLLQLDEPPRTFVVLAEQDRRRILELEHFRSFRTTLVFYHQRTLPQMMRLASQRDQAAVAIQRKFRAIRLGLAGWRRSHQRLGGTIRLLRQAKQRAVDREHNARLLASEAL